MKDDGSCEHAETSPSVAMSPMPVVERAAALLKAVSDPGRLRLLERLARAGEQCVSELAAGDGLSATSHRLRLLRAEHLVTRRREGKHVYYTLRDSHVSALIFAALEHAAEGRERR